VSSNLYTYVFWITQRLTYNQQIAMQADWVLEKIMPGYINGIRSVHGSARGCAKFIDYNTYD
jgi:hypothetical protein